MMTATLPMPHDPVDRHAALQALRNAASAAAALYLDELESEVTVRSIREQLRELLAQSIAHLRTLQPIDEDLAVIDPVGDLAFGGTLELGHVLRILGAVRADEELLVAIEAARRKLMRVARALLTTANMPGIPPIDVPFDDELDAARAVRRSYAELRRSLRQPVDESPEAVLQAVRYAVGGLATLVASSVYREVRIQDRLVLRGLRDRALSWARHDKSPQEGLRLLGDIVTCADLLRGINRRQELRTHDESLTRALAVGPTSDSGSWWQQLRALEGLDDELDQMADAARKAPSTANAAIATICERLNAILPTLA